MTVLKKVFYALMATLVAIPVFFSCVEKEQELPVMEENPVIPTAYEYSFEIADGETRALLTEEGVLWENGDPVGLFVKSGDSPAVPMETEVLVQEGSSPKVVFSTTEPLAAGTQVYAYYPYQAGSAGVDAAKIVFPHAQQGGSVSAMPMAGLPVQVRQGEGSNGTIRFLNLGSVIDFRVYSASHAGERIQSITFAVNSGAFVSGEATLDVSGVSGSSEGFSVPGLAWTVGESSVTLKQDATVALNKELASRNNLFMVVAPGTYDGTITILTDAAAYSFDFTNVVLERNGIKGFNMNLDGSKATRSKEYVRVNSLADVVSGGTYLIVDESESRVFHPILNPDGSTYQTSGNAESAVITENRIPVASGTAVDASRVILEKVSGTTSDFYIRVPSANGSYFYLSNGAFKSGQKASALSFDQSGGVTVKRSNSSYYLHYQTGAFTSSSRSSTLALYTPDPDGRQAQSLQFSAPSFSCTIYGQALPMVDVAGVPTLSGGQTPVTYYSSDPSVASVSSDGSITVWKDGKVVITAVAEADDRFLSAQASYMLTVWDGFCLENGKVETYLNLVEAKPYNPPADYSFTHMSAELQAGNTDQVNRLDWPKPVPVRWTTSASGTPEIIVYDESGQEEKMANVTITSSTSADIYSLIPGRTYTYVVRDGQTQIGDGTFRTTGRRRMIKVADSPYGRMFANNCRDFGGQLTQDGRMIRYGKVFRGSNMDKVTASQLEYLLNYMHIRLDVDLRTTGNDAGAGDNTLFDGLDLVNHGGQHTTETFNSWGDFSNSSNGVYKLTSVLTKIFDTVHAEHGVYIHCKVGADRTGYVCMLLEAILGVEQGWCDVDYELTSFAGAVDEGIGRWRVGAVSGLSNNWYYRPRSNTVQGVDYIYSLQQGDYQRVYPDNSFQAKAVNYVVKTLKIPFEKVQTFQNDMLE